VTNKFFERSSRFHQIIILKKDIMVVVQNVHDSVKVTLEVSPIIGRLPFYEFSLIHATRSSGEQKSMAVDKISGRKRNI